MEKLDIIWNLTRVCQYKCKICCVNALYSRDIKIQQGIKKKEQDIKKELNLKEKLQVVKDFECSYKFRKTRS